MTVVIYVCRALIWLVTSFTEKLSEFLWEAEKFSDRPVLAVMNGGAESDPNVEHSQPAAQSAGKAAGDPRAQRRMSEKEIIVRPLRPPRNDEHEHSHGGAEKNEQQHVDAMKPEFHSGVRNDGGLCGCAFARSGPWSQGANAWLVFWGQGIAVCGHARLPKLRCAGLGS